MMKRPCAGGRFAQDADVDEGLREIDGETSRAGSGVRVFGFDAEGEPGRANKIVDPVSFPKTTKPSANKPLAGTQPTGAQLPLRALGKHGIREERR